jgi:hypothetical protein
MNSTQRIATLHIQAKSYDRIVYSPKPLDSFRSVRQVKTTNYLQKPKGLWYACGKDWKEYVNKETNSEWASSFKYKNLLEVNLNRMCVIRTKQELWMFTGKYGIEITGQDAIDWVAVSKDYDGIEICPYQSSESLRVDWYYSWDVGSGCIWGTRAFKGVAEVENDIDDGEFISPSDPFWDEEEDEEDDDYSDW